MTYEEVRKICDSMWQADLLNADIRKVRESLEKQIPEKPIDDYRYKPKICPHCHDFLENYQSFCDNCGQKIDWSDEE